MKYLVIVETGRTSVGAYVPDLPGCVAAVTDREEVLALIHDAIELHVEDLRQQGLTVPLPNCVGEVVDVLA